MGNVPSYSLSPYSSLTAQAAQARASLRPPVSNPYDRFPKPEFDTWIRDITSALKRALGEEAEVEVDSPSRHSGAKIGGAFSTDGRAQSPASPEARDDESTFENSFAQIASRRAKGKARDPREGPGLGFKGQPIELSSDSEEEEVVNSLEAGAVSSEDSDVSVEEDSGEDTDPAESESDEGGEANFGLPGTSTQHIVTLASREKFGQGQELAGAPDVEVHHTGYEDLQSPRSAEAFREDDDDRSADSAVLRDRGTSDEFPVQSESAVTVDVELVDPWEGPRTFAEDYYSGGDRLAPSLTPNHLTPLAGSPAPTFVPDLPTVPNTGANEDQLSPSAGVLSTSPLPKPHIIVNNEDIGEPVAGSYYDPVEVVDVTVRGTMGRHPDQPHEIIAVPPSDDEHTDADGEEDEERFLGLLPLGTSDLDIRDDWGDAGMREDVDDVSEEDELQEIASSQAADEVGKAVALTLSRAVNSDTLNAPLVNPPAPILASTFQLADTDSFGDLPVSSPPSETPSPAPGQPTGAFELQQHSIEELFADLERESSERRSESPGSLARQSEAETAGAWASQELENILSGDISAPDSVVEVSGSTSTERSIPQEALFSAHYPGYIVEEVKFETQILIPDDDFGETRSIPPPDLADVVETIQLYDVEEPKADSRLTEESEITIESPRNEGITVPQLVVSSVDSTATPITSEQHEQHVYPVPSTQGPSQRAPVDDASQTELSSTVPNIPAPTVADPSVPDPVPGDSSHPSPVIADSPNAPGLSINPPAFLRVTGLDSQISSSSGLFTPAQRSEGGTPVQLEDDSAEALTASHNGADKSPATASIPLQPDDDLSPIERSITGYKDGGDDEDNDACVDDIIESSQPNERHMEVGTVGVDAQIPAVGAAESADKISLLSRGGTTEQSVSQLPKEDSTLVCDLSSRHPLKGFPQHPGTLDPSSERLLKSPSIAGGDEDADGEVDPDYSHIYGAKYLHQTIAHQPDGGVSFNKIIRATFSPKVATLGLESRPTSVSVQRQEEPEAAGQTFSSSLGDTSPASQNSPPAEGGVVQDKRDFGTSVQSEVKASNEKGHQSRALKRKRRDPNVGSARITRSESGGGVKRGKKKGPVLSSRRTTATSEKAQSSWVGSNVDADSVDDGTSETASVSSGTSAVYRLLRATSRTRSVVSSTSGDASWTSPPTPGLGSVIPLIHSHGFHRHDRPAPLSPTSSTGPHKGTRSEPAKAKSPIPTQGPSTPSLRRTPSINSPVTRSNCRFHKISLPRGEDRVRAYFVVPGCALGDGELMGGNDIRDEGFSTHEDHKRMLPNVETLDLNPYLVGVLRQLVGVDLLREQQEIFYLPSEEEKPKKRRQTDALERLRQLRRQSISSGGPLARDHSPRLSEISRGTPRSASGSVVSDFVREGSTVRSIDEDIIPSEPDEDEDPGETPTKWPRLSAVEINPPLASTFTDGELDHSAALERSTLEGEEPTISSGPPAPRRSKRKALNFDAAGYKPGEDDVKEDEVVEETKAKRSSTRKATKRSRTAEEISTNAPKSKRKRLGRSISAAGADAMDS